jgi:hypothetical protein
MKEARSLIGCQRVLGAQSLKGAALCEPKHARTKWAALLVIALSFGLVILFSPGSLVEPTALAQGPQYVGSERCALCHRDIFDAWAATGHAHKLWTAAEARAAGIPKPSYVSWDDIFLVVGGFKWKARYIGQDGFFITQSPDGSIRGKNQFNRESEQFSDWNAGARVAYDSACAVCHTTGYTPTGSQFPDKPGIVGTWAFNSIQCEACHGPGGEHVNRSSKANIRVDKSAEACAQCHRRGTDMTVVPASGGFIEHREQYQEMLKSKHAGLNCVSCHNPHKRARQDPTATCATCHPDVVAEYTGSRHHKAGVRCEQCHMPNAARTAVRRGPFEGDLPSHLFKINTDVTAPMFTPDGRFAMGYLTWQYACLPCHAGRDQAWAAQYLVGIHKVGK